MRREATTLRRRRGGLRKVPLARLWAVEGEDVVCEVQGGDGFERLRVYGVGFSRVQWMMVWMDLVLTFCINSTRA